MIADIALRLAPFAAVAAVSVAGYHALPIIGPGARIERLSDDRDTWKAKEKTARDLAKDWQASFRDSEAKRRVDQVAAGNAVTAAERACDTRLTEARRSTKIIERIVNAPSKPDPSGCPARALVDPGLLRDALTAPR